MTPSTKLETRITLRLTDRLSEWVSQKASERGISNNAQINITLHDAMKADEVTAQK